MSVQNGIFTLENMQFKDTISVGEIKMAEQKDAELTPSHTHQKYIYTWKNSQRVLTESWQKIFYTTKAAGTIPLVTRQYQRMRVREEESAQALCPWEVKVLLYADDMIGYTENPKYSIPTL